MNEVNAFEACGHLESQGYRLPYGVWAQYRPPVGSTPLHFDEKGWENYVWNPPQGYEHDGPDPSADPKPSWNELVSAHSVVISAVLKIELGISLKQETQRRITEAYGEEDFRGEMELRLRGGHTPIQDRKRDSLRARYKVLRAWLQSSDRTLEELDVFDPTDDSHWKE